MNYKTIQDNFIAQTYPNRGVTFVRGKGSYLFDENGEKYIDMLGGSYGVGVLGYGIGSITKALQSQINTLFVLHSSFSNDKRSLASFKLIQNVSKAGFTNLKRVFWSNSGAESIEAALKFAMLYTKKYRLIAAINSYHGKTLGALSINNSGNGKYQTPFKNVLLPVDWIRFGDIHSLEQVISTHHAAVILEPIQGEGGVITPPPDYFPKVYTLCKKYNVPLIIDEIQTGLGRTGTMYNSQRYIQNGFTCDMLCLGKGLAYGIPVGATVISDRINSALSKGIHTSTFGANPLAMTGVYEVLSYLETHPRLVTNATAKGAYIRNNLETLKKRYPTITDISGTGLMIGIGLSIDPIIVLKKLQEQHIIAAPTSTNRIRFLPALTIQKKDIDSTLDAFSIVLSSYK
ncbi:MAG: aminotransferase class III-fold pyridoxal phosphate-dependent enzyme [Candidatus Roizmanbacteria bacterium]|nr:aminotransferase class III-fold pyridoxal phosphate-dependent enzyme [Candidatus Roizmanbacteria bacterium]